MKYYTEFYGHLGDIQGKRKKIDNTIYSFDIESTSYIILNNEILPASEYENLTKDEQEKCEKKSLMYIWMFSINDEVYYR